MYQRNISDLENMIYDLCHNIAYEYYYESDDDYVFNHNRYNTLMLIARNPNQLTRNKRRILRMIEMADDQYDFDDLESLYNRFDSYIYYLNQQKNYKIENKPIQKELRKMYFIMNQLNRFDGFKMNQNKFDNYISLIKIIQRYQLKFNEKINIEPIFNSSNFDEESIRNELKQFFIDDKIKNIIFKYDLTEVVL